VPARVADESPFRSQDEFREVVDRLVAMLGDDPVLGQRLQDADVPESFDFADVGLVVHVRAAGPGEDGRLVWAWGDDADWEPRVLLHMSSAVANRYFQGKENVAIAVARRRIKAEGDLKAAFSLFPIFKSAVPHYRALIEADYGHLVV
jgi:hypothetical protein